MKRYWINEIFHSIQGEGANAGMPAVFVRFAGCNLACGFCDTDHREQFVVTAPEIISEIENYNCKSVVLTGGEPTLQVDDVLVKGLKERGFYVCIETNGTRPVPAGIDWITVSPKVNWKVKKGDELKVVFQGQGQDLRQYAGGFDHYYLQPCSMENVNETLQAVMENPKWKLSLQLQKVLKIS